MQQLQEQERATAEILVFMLTKQAHYAHTTASVQPGSGSARSYMLLNKGRTARGRFLANLCTT